MSETVWVKACDCPNASAGCGRLIVQEEPVAEGLVRYTTTFHPGPVCNTCDTPWALLPAAPQPEGT